MDTSKILTLSTKYHSLLNTYEVNTPLRLAHFFGQLYHESKCVPIEENLNYSPERLGQVFPKYFPTKELANSYGNKPNHIANRIYGGRMGNGVEATGDGWKYRGRGFIQLTGKDNYMKATTDTKIDFYNNPDLLLEEPNAMICALWYWTKIKGNKFADKDDIKTITYLINGGLIGLDDRIKNVIALKEAF
jgi:putative chitinase